MNAATERRRAEAAIAACRYLLQGMETVSAAHERTCENLNRVFEKHGIDPVPYEDIGVATAAYTNKVRAILIDLEDA